MVVPYLEQTSHLASPTWRLKIMTCIIKIYIYIYGKLFIYVYYVRRQYSSEEICDVVIFHANICCRFHVETIIWNSWNVCTIWIYAYNSSHLILLDSNINKLSTGFTLYISDVWTKCTHHTWLDDFTGNMNTYWNGQMLKYNRLYNQLRYTRLYVRI